MKVGIPLLATLLACGGPQRLNLTFSGTGAWQLHNSMLPVVADLNADLGCEAAAVDSSDGHRHAVVVSIDANEVKSLDAGAVGIYCTWTPGGPADHIYLMPYVLPPMATADGVVPGKPVGTDDASAYLYSLEVEQDIFIHEMGHAFGLNHEKSGIMAAVLVAPVPTPADAAADLASVLHRRGVETCMEYR